MLRTGTATVTTLQPEAIPQRQGWVQVRKQGTRNKHRRLTYLDSSVLGLDFGAHHNSLENLLRAVMERVFFVKLDGRHVAPPRPARGAFLTLTGFRKRVLRRLNKGPQMTRTQFVESYTGHRRTRYEHALADLILCPVKREDAFSSPFVKCEKTNFTAKPDPAPRLISPRSARYNIEVGVYIKPLEHELYKAIDCVFGARVVAKGANAVDRATMLRDAWDDFAHPVAVSLDASRFDQHVSVDALRFEHLFYTSAYDSDRHLTMLLSWQLETLGYGRTQDDGFLKYKVRGTRCSGDMNTSCGNVIIMCAMMHGFFSNIGVRARLVNDGDDCVVVVEKEDVQILCDTVESYFELFGFTMRIDGLCDEFEEVDFCQCRPVFDGDRWIMSRDPRLCYVKDLMVTRPLLSEHEWRAHCTAIALSGLALAGNLPVFRSFYRRLNLRSRKPALLNSGMWYWSRGLEVKDSPPTSAARLSFWKAFNITPHQQRAIEDVYDATTLSYQTPRDRTTYIENTISPIAYLLAQS